MNATLGAVGSGSQWVMGTQQWEVWCQFMWAMKNIKGEVGLGGLFRGMIVTTHMLCGDFFRWSLGIFGSLLKNQCITRMESIRVFFFAWLRWIFWELRMPLPLPASGYTRWFVLHRFYLWLVASVDWMMLQKEVMTTQTNIMYKCRVYKWLSLFCFGVFGVTKSFRCIRKDMKNQIDQPSW